VFAFMRDGCHANPTLQLSQILAKVVPMACLCRAQTHSLSHSPSREFFLRAFPMFPGLVLKMPYLHEASISFGRWNGVYIVIDYANLTKLLHPSQQMMKHARALKQYCFLLCQSLTWPNRPLLSYLLTPKSAESVSPGMTISDERACTPIDAVRCSI
jgi:hypothetical protein